ncbi:hypothetical protein ACFELO_06680 [Oceanicaulis sp. LC35]|uniref:hypothetical protein n=1 Tax=Oceanicaulis sp. LC35 TaxID=3349635 RepID=UPI003F877F32
MSNIIITPSPKEAALYYDYVVPLGLYSNDLPQMFEAFSLLGSNAPHLVPEIVGALQSNPDAASKRSAAEAERNEIRDQLLPPNLIGRNDDIERLEEAMASQALNTLMRGFFNDIVKNNIVDVKDRFGLLSSHAKNISFSATRELVDFLGEVGLRGAILDFPLSNNGPSHNAMELNLCDVNFIDEGKLKWEQVFEIRKDPVSRMKLLNFRKYFYSELSCLSLSQAKEEIERLQGNYLEAAKKHGAEFKLATLKTILESKMALAGVGGVLLSAQSGNWPMLLASTVPITLTVGEIILTAKSAYHEGNELANSHPISYLVTVEKALNK